MICGDGVLDGAISGNSSSLDVSLGCLISVLLGSSLDYGGIIGDANGLLDSLLGDGGLLGSAISGSNSSLLVSLSSFLDYGGLMDDGAFDSLLGKSGRLGGAINGTSSSLGILLDSSLNYGDMTTLTAYLTARSVTVACSAAQSGSPMCPTAYSTARSARRAIA